MGITAPGTEFFRPETKPKFRVVSPARDRISKIVRRTGRVNAACSHKVSVIRDSGDCVVADAVLVEPVSNENSLLTGKLTGNFVESACLPSALEVKGTSTDLRVMSAFDPKRT
jgi:hypothetical protein